MPRCRSGRRTGVYRRLHDGPGHARECLAEFHARYNRKRPRWALVLEGGGDPVAPEEVYCGGVVVGIPRWQGWARDTKRRLDELMAADAESHARKAGRDAMAAG